MNLLTTVFRFEWKRMVRQPGMLLAVLLYLLLGSYGIYSGQKVIDIQLNAIDTVKASAQNDFKNTLKAFTDTLTAEKRYQAERAGSPYLIDYRMPRIAIDYPKGMAGLSIGLRDLTPLSEKVSYSADYSDKNQEITNPVLLFEGNIDLSFVIVFLLPLLVIVFCYDLLSAEKEQGSYTLLMVQSGGFRHITIYRLFFRFLLICTATLLLNLYGILNCPLKKLFLSDIFLWFIAVFSYLVFWFSICFLVISLKKDTLNNALYLLGFWLLFLFILPALTGIYIKMEHPAQIRADVEDIERHIGEEVWFSDPAQIVLSFYDAHPQYAKAFDPKDTTNNQNDAFFAGYAYLKEKRMSANIAEIQKANDKANQAARDLLMFSPAQQVQDILNTLAGTSRTDYLGYREQVATFQKEWAKVFYDRIFHTENAKRRELNFKPEELNQLMVFHRKILPLSIKDFFVAMAPLWITTMILSLFAYLLFKHKLT
mgnify:FL=1